MSFCDIAKKNIPRRLRRESGADLANNGSLEFLQGGLISSSYGYLGLLSHQALNLSKGGVGREKVVPTHKVTERSTTVGGQNGLPVSRLYKVSTDSVFMM